ncbi:LPP20 family lipoprotein [Nitrospira sp. M1]
MNIVRVSMVGTIVMLGMGLLFGGCASQAPVKERTLNQLVKDGDGPEWLVSGGKSFSGDKKAFYGVGSAGRVRNPALMRRSAAAQARRDIASQFKVYVAAMNKQYLADITAGDGDAHSEEQAVTDTMKEITDATLQGVTIEEYWEHPERNEAYALARLDLDAFLEKVRNYANAKDEYKELSEKVRERVERNAEKAFDELQGELDKR